MPINEELENSHLVFGLTSHWYQLFCNGFGPATIDADGFEVQQPLDTMVFQWFPMVGNHWSNDEMVTIHRRVLLEG